VRAADPRRDPVADLEGEDAAVFEKAAEDAADGDALAQPGDARAERADPAGDDLDRRAGRGRGVQGVDDLGVDERVDLQPDPRGLADPGGVADAPDLVQDAVAQEPGPDEQLPEDRRLQA